VVEGEPPTAERRDLPDFRRGGNLEKNVSPNLVRALQYAKDVSATILGVVGRDGGYTAKVGDAVCVVPTVNPVETSYGQLRSSAS
jgi:hypothetical protein